MLKHRIIPCLDVDNGRVVKGVKFIELRDAGDPVEVAARYDAEGADELVFLDISASHEGRSTMVETVRRTAEKIFLPLTVGGGISDLEGIRELLRAGCDKVSINSAACRDPELVRRAADRFGSQCIVVNIDPKRVPSQATAGIKENWRWEVFTHGGRRPTGLEAVAWAETVEGLGAGELVITSMDRDGTNEGYDLELLQAIAERVSIPVVASGGAGHPEHMVEAIQIGKADAVLAAGIFHFGKYRIQEVKRYLADRGIPVRWKFGEPTSIEAIESGSFDLY